MLLSQWIALKYCTQYDRLSQQQRSFLFVKSIKTLLPLCIEHEYKLGYCGHFSVSAITLSGTVAKKPKKRSSHIFHDNSIHTRTHQITIMNNKKLSYRRETARQLPTLRGRAARPSSPVSLRPLWLHLCVWSNPKPATNVHQVCRPLSAL